MRMKKNLVVLLGAVALAGCAMPTKQPVASEITEVPRERVERINEQVAPLGRISVTRDVGLLGSGCYLGLLVEGQPAAKLDPGERYSVELSAGRHLLTATFVKGRGLCGIGSEKQAAAQRRSTEIFVDAGQNRPYRIRTGETDVTIEPAF